MKRYPKLKEAWKDVPLWTEENHHDVCDYMSGRNTSSKTAAAQIRSLDAYMKHAALRVPDVPKHASSAIKVLYRGVPSETFPPKLAVGKVVRSNSGCFTAMSYIKDTALEFTGYNNRGILFRLNVSQIARGTPWIWFKYRQTVDNMIFHAKRLHAPFSHSNEREVLLPPGYFKIIRISRDSKNHVALVDVAYAPEPRYFLRRALPHIEASTGNAIVNTTASPLRIPRSTAFTTGVETRAMPPSPVRTWSPEPRPRSTSLARHDIRTGQNDSKGRKIYKTKRGRVYVFGDKGQELRPAGVKKKILKTPIVRLRKAMSW